MRTRVRLVEVMLLVMILLQTISCNSFRSTTTKTCCQKLDSVLKSKTVMGDLFGSPGLFAEYDGVSIVAFINTSPEHSHAFRTTNGGVTWQSDPLYDQISESALPRTDGRDEPIQWLPTVSQQIKYRTVSRRLSDQDASERSTDGGITWKPMKFRLIGCETRLNTLEIRHYYHPKNPFAFFLVAELPWRKGSSGMFASTDGGDSFSFMYECYGATPIISVSRSNPEVMYASAVMGNLAKSTDSGQTWPLIGQADLIRKIFPGPPGDGNSEISDIVIHPTDSKIVYLVVNQKIIRTQDGGATWCLLKTEALGPIAGLAILATDPYPLLVGSSKGLFKSTNGGCDWELIDIKSRITTNAQ